MTAQLTPGESAALFDELDSMHPSRASLDRLPKDLSPRWESQRTDWEAALRAQETVAAEASVIAISVDEDPAAGRRFWGLAKPHFPIAWDAGGEVKERFRSRLAEEGGVKRLMETLRKATYVSVHKDALLIAPPPAAVPAP